jgi:hypothetical protein
VYDGFAGTEEIRNKQGIVLNRGDNNSLNELHFLYLYYEVYYASRGTSAPIAVCKNMFVG